jgi:undecaprenyl-diphosphatase
MRPNRLGKPAAPALDTMFGNHAERTPMNWWQAIILGIVEGLTEYLPVSSTGHLILAQRAMGIVSSAEANAFAICIQAGAILAVLGLYRRRVLQMTKGVLGAARLTKPDPGGLKLAINIIAAFLPAAVVGVLLDDWIESKLFGLWPVVASWLVGGLAILAVVWLRMGRNHSAAVGDRGDPIRERGGLDHLSWRTAVLIGLIQCVAMWPGTSRALVTIVGGVLVGLSLAAAVEFSFLLGVVTLLAATVFKAKDAGPVMLQAYGWTPMILGSLAAWLSAVLAVQWMVSYLKRRGLALFGYYRVALALAVAALILANVLSA